jgi:hypothetical protein
MIIHWFGFCKGYRRKFTIFPEYLWGGGAEYGWMRESGGREGKG